MNRIAHTRPEARARRRQDGYVLATSLIFMLVLTLAAASAMRSSGIEQRMATNSAFKQRSFESSEAARGAFAEVLDPHIFYRGWPSPLGGLAANAFTIPSGLSVRDSDNNSASDLLYKNKVSAGLASRLDDYTTADGSYAGDANGDGATDLPADVYVQQMGVIQAPGAAIAMIAGYEGSGKSNASGGGQMLLDIRSRGRSSGGDGALSLTGSAYRHVIRN